MTLRELDAASVLDFVSDCGDYLTGQVLDFGCGKQPYREVVERAGGTYHPYDRVQFPANVSREDFGWTAEQPRLHHYDAALCTQVIQYLPDPGALLTDLNRLLRPGGYLLLTGPTNWPVIEIEDLTRYTLHGVRTLLIESGYRVLRLVERGQAIFEGEEWSIGWAALAEPL